MKNKSILNAILELRKQVRGSSTSQSDFLASLIGAGSQEDCTVTTSDGSSYEFDFNSSGSCNVIKRDGSETRSFTLESVDGEFDIDSAFDGNFNTLGDFMKDVAESNNLNQVIDNVSSLFITQPNVDVNVIQNVINSCSTDVNSQSLRQFSALMNLNSNGGKVSQYSFLNIVKNMYSARDTGGNGLEMDDTSAFFVKNAIGTILKAVFTAFAEILAAVLSMVNVVVGMIVAAISKIFATITDAVNSVANKDVIVKDYDSPTNFFDGVLIASNDRFLGAYVQQDDLKSSGLNAVTVEVGPATFYMWRTSSDHDGVDYMSINGFLSMGLHPERTIAAIVNDSRITCTLSSGYNPGSRVNYSFASAGGGYVDLLSIINSAANDCYLTIEEQTSLKYGSSTKRNAYALFNRAILDYLTLQFQYGQSYHLELQPYWSATPTVNDPLIANIYLVNKAIACYVSNGNLTSWVSDCGSSAFATELTDIMIKTLDQYGSSWTGGGSLSDGYRWNQRLAFLNPTQTGNQIYYLAHPLGCVTSWSSSSSFTWKNCTPWISDVIPTTRTWSFASASWADIAAAIAIAATIATAAIVCVSVGRAYIKKLTFRKQLKAYSKVQQARNNYIDSETGVIKNDPDGANFNAYYKAVKRYNLYGKLFGWGSYDPVNNWVNQDSTVSTPVGNNQFNSGLASASALENTSTSINQVLHAITG